MGILLLLAGLAAVFCANLLILSKFASPVNIDLRYLSEDPVLRLQQRKISKHLYDPKSNREALSF
jgi:hypothetical protein